jgi:site-specific DNA recombinase
MKTAMKSAAIYARVSSDKQKEENTIASQTSASVEFARKNGYAVPDEWVFERRRVQRCQSGVTRTRTFV